jgi:hypothetical protein
MTGQEALYEYIYGTEFDSDSYESLEDAIEGECVEERWTHYGLPVYSIDGGEYAVAEDWEDAENAALESVKSLIDDIGVSGFSMNMQNFVESRWFEEAEREMHESYAYDIKDESSSDEDLYVSRLHEELVDYSLMDALELPEEPDYEDEDAHDEWEKECDDLRSSAEKEANSKIDELADAMMSNDSVEYYIDNFGEEDFNEVVTREGLIDEDEVAEYVVKMDGVAHVLAGYDGEEHENGGCYFYRIN